MNPSHPFANGRPAAASQAPPFSQQTNKPPFPKVAPPDPAAAAPTEPTGRDSSGRFCRGNKGGPGNPFARKTAALRQAMLDTVAAEDLQAIVRQLIQQAKDGDVSAARLVLSYTIGKPDKAVDPDTLDVQEWNLYQQSNIANEDFLGVMGGLEPPLASTIARAALPPIQEATAQTLGQQLLDSLADPASGGEAAQHAQDTSAPDTVSPTQQEIPAPPPKRAAQPKPARAKRERVAQSNPVPPPSAPGSNDAIDLQGDREQWLAFLQEVLRQASDPEGHTLSGETPPPKANGVLTDGPPR